MYFGVVLSPCYGKVERISVKRESRFCELESLFVLKTRDGKQEFIQSSVSGEVESLEVQEGDDVIPGMVLAYVKEDMFITGSG
ncbi:hypothetical protein BABA_09941 [Neobacillus bataviensis LMG 21833]|uniref:Uncharacterized protein n=1 Tax=Neobacillus bataviensis LMG 21833 TaxID=1117379 RepID=K6DA05_9BACI|nr:biotin/lipoyl-binding protein [Neobacillus bataviensis]EKN69372.1 hypothetical protein BABA_09941 [Neobacillus bataviensis LMG 21833]